MSISGSSAGDGSNHFSDFETVQGFSDTDIDAGTVSQDSGFEYLTQGGKLYIGFLRGEGGDKLFYPVSVNVGGKDLVKDALETGDHGRVQELAKHVYDLVTATDLNKPAPPSIDSGSIPPPVDNLSGLILSARYQETASGGSTTGIPAAATALIERIDIDIPHKLHKTVNRGEDVWNTVAPHFNDFRVFFRNPVEDEDDDSSMGSVTLGSPVVNPPLHPPSDGNLSGSASTDDGF